MGSETVVRLTIGLICLAAGGFFTAGGFYIYVKMSITHLEEWGRDNHKTLDLKIDKNYESLEKKVDELRRDVMGDLSGIGSKVSRHQDLTAKRHINTLAAVLIAAPTAKEKEISELMREG
jgi:hypothetical protein